MSADGRLVQSIAFLNTPGSELLYSGVTSRTPGAAAMRSLSAWTAGGIPVASTSPSYSGMSLIEAASTVVPAGASSAAARSSIALNDFSRRLPAIARMVVMSGLDLESVDLQPEGTDQVIDMGARHVEHARGFQDIPLGGA